MHHMEKQASGWMKETQKGYIRIAVLILLNKKPHHGYEMMKTVKERTSGFWKPTAGGIYPILQDLENSGYVKGEWDQTVKRKRKIYKITSEGKKILEHALAKENRLISTMMDLFKEYMKDVLDVNVSQEEIPRPPNFFALFLEERKEKPEDTKKILEGKRAQMEDMIKNLQQEVLQINKRLALLDKKEASDKEKNKKLKEEKN